MGLDLRLLPCERWSESNGRVGGYSHTILELGGVGHDDYESFLEMVKPHLADLPVGHDVSSFVGARVPEGHHKGVRVYGTIRSTDAYGVAYKVVEARHLLPWLAEHFRYAGDRGPYQAAIVAYVRALPAETKIVLDWY